MCKDWTNIINWINSILRQLTFLSRTNFFYIVTAPKNVKKKYILLRTVMHHLTVCHAGCLHVMLFKVQIYCYMISKEHFYYDVPLHYLLFYLKGFYTYMESVLDAGCVALTCFCWPSDSRISLDERCNFLFGVSNHWSVSSRNDFEEFLLNFWVFFNSCCCSSFILQTVLSLQWIVKQILSVYVDSYWKIVLQERL